MSIDLYLPAFPELTRSLHTSESTVQLSLTTFLIGLAVGQVIIGPLSDAIGRRRPLIVGMAGYVVASVLCAVAPTIEVLIVGRLLQGLAGSVGSVLALALVRDLFDGPDVARVMSRLILVLGIAPVFAPTLGGQLLTITGWRGLFVVLTIFGVVMTVVVFLFVRETLPEENRQQAGARATVRSYRAVLSDRRYLAYAGIQIFGFMLIFGYVSGSPFAYQEVHGVSPQLFGLLFGANAVGMVIASQLNARLVMRHDSFRILSRALPVTVLAAFALVLTTVTGLGGLPGFAVPLFVLMTTVGLVLPNGGALALNRHPHHAGTAAAFVGMSQFAVGALVGPVVSAFGAGTVLPMVVAIAVGATGMAVVAAAIARRNGPTRPARGAVDDASAKPVLATD